MKRIKRERMIGIILAAFAAAAIIFGLAWRDLESPDPDFASGVSLLAADSVANLAGDSMMSLLTGDSLAPGQGQELAFNLPSFLPNLPSL